ncbi:MAG: tRNA glutamyl-Q(34) synthetase GluQRS [Pseudomonadota bacterium]
MPLQRGYRGRFAPSPSGSLHFGSLVTALASYLDAKQHLGSWLVRIEDLDRPRVVPGAADDILRTLELFGLHSDEPAIYQSLRTSAYEEALMALRKSGVAYPCTCSRKEISDSGQHGVEGVIYPGICRNGILPTRQAQAWRVRTDVPARDHFSAAQTGEVIKYDDLLQGRIQQHLANEVGDFVVRRADGLMAYQLAVVVDDQSQGITHVVRGADLLTSTPRQIHLQHLLNYCTPAYMHIPLAVDAHGEKLSKQTLAAPVDSRRPVATLLRLLRFLRQDPPDELATYDLITVLDWAVTHWDTQRLNGIKQLRA